MRANIGIDANEWCHTLRAAPGRCDSRTLTEADDGLPYVMHYETGRMRHVIRMVMSVAIFLAIFLVGMAAFILAVLSAGVR